MTKIKIFFFLCLMFSNLFISRGIMAEESKDLINLVLKDGTVVIETRPDLAPKHVAQIKKLVSEGLYDGVVFHRVIEGFMAQTMIHLILVVQELEVHLYLILMLNFLMQIMEEAQYLWLEHKIQIVQIVNFLYALKMLLF